MSRLGLVVTLGLSGLLASCGRAVSTGCEFDAYSDDAPCAELDSLFINPGGFEQAVTDPVEGLTSYQPLEGVCELKCINVLQASVDGAWGSLRDVPAFGKLRKIRRLGINTSNLKDLDGLQRITVEQHLDLTATPKDRENPAQVLTLTNAGNALRGLQTLSVLVDNLESFEGAGPLPALESVSVIGRQIGGLIHLRGLETATKIQGVRIEDSPRLMSLDGFPAVKELGALSITGTALTSLDGMPAGIKIRYQLFINANPQLSNCVAEEFAERAVLPGATVDTRRNGPCR